MNINSDKLSATSASMGNPPKKNRNSRYQEHLSTNSQQHWLIMGIPKQELKIYEEHLSRQSLNNEMFMSKKWMLEISALHFFLLFHLFLCAFACPLTKQEWHLQTYISKVFLMLHCGDLHCQSIVSNKLANCRCSSVPFDRCLRKLLNTLLEILTCEAPDLRRRRVT